MTLSVLTVPWVMIQVVTLAPCAATSDVVVMLQRPIDQAQHQFKELVQGDFRLADMLLQESEDRCHVPDFGGNNKSVLALAVARAGSESLSEAMRRAGQPLFHHHHCRARDLFARAGKNIRALVVPLRDPVARIISGYQRRCEGNLGGEHEINRVLVREFVCPNGLNSWIDALRNSSHEKHALATRLVYKFNAQTNFLPVVEFYLADAPLDRVHFVCTCQLEDDMAKLGHRLDLPVQMPKTGQSKRRSGLPSVQKKFLSEENTHWLRKIYAADYRLFQKHCRCT